MQTGLGSTLTTTYTGDDGTGEVETERSEVQCHPQLLSDFKDSLGYKKPGVKVNKHENEALIRVKMDTLSPK